MANYVFILGYLQPHLLANRISKGDINGLMDHRLVMSSERMIHFFDDIAPHVNKDSKESLHFLFSRVYENHDHVSVMDTIHEGILYYNTLAH